MISISIHLSVINNSVIISFSKKKSGAGGRRERPENKTRLLNFGYFPYRNLCLKSPLSGEGPSYLEEGLGRIRS